MSLKDLKAAYAQSKSLALKAVIERLEAEQARPADAVAPAVAPAAIEPDRPAVSNASILPVTVRKNQEHRPSGEKKAVKAPVVVRKPPPRPVKGLKKK